MSTSTIVPISPKQRRFIERLLEERKDAIGIVDVEAFMLEQGVDLLSIGDASTFINKLKAIEVPSNPEHSHLPKGHVIENKRDGFCSHCGGVVSVGEGFAVAVGYRQWNTYHRKGECFSEAQALESIECGRYALPNLKGTNDLDFFIVHVRGGTKEMLRTIGGHAHQRMTHNETKTHVERLSSLSPEERVEARALYGKELGVCGRCGRHLTDEASRARGLGSECATK